MKNSLNRNFRVMTGTAIPAVFMALSLSTAAADAAETGRPEAPPQITGVTAPPQTSTTAPTAVQPPRYAQEILSALKHLSALLSKGARVDQNELDSVAAEIAGLDARVKNLLGPALLKEIEDQEKELLDNTRIARAKGELAGARSALMLYYDDLEGKYPAAPAELIPKYMPAMPELDLPGHARTSAVELADAAGPDIGKAVTDTGGWLYFANPKSQNFGMLVLNCSHKDDKGTELYRY